MPDVNNNSSDLEIPVKDKTGDFQFIKIDSLELASPAPPTPAVPAVKSEPVAPQQPIKVASKPQPAIMSIAKMSRKWSKLARQL